MDIVYNEAKTTRPLSKLGSLGQKEEKEKERRGQIFPFLFAHFKILYFVEPWA
jgi:hypothetical protein